MVVKLYNRHRYGYAEAFARELAAYSRLVDLQGKALPRLLLHGVFEYTGAFFLALSDEGDDLEAVVASDPAGAAPDPAGLSESQRSGMLTALRLMHSKGVLHGDIRLANFLSGRDGVVKAADLERASFEGLPISAAMQAAMQAEEQAVQML